MNPFKKTKFQHHHGFDLKDNQETSTCKCGVTITNPYYQVGMNPATRMPNGYYPKFANISDWGTDDDYFNN